MYLKEKFRSEGRARRKMTVNKIVYAINRAALLRKSWQKLLEKSPMRKERSKITERGSIRGRIKRENEHTSLHSRYAVLQNYAK